MNITTDQLLEQHERARETWPFIDTVEKEHGLPALLLYAVGSRETNLRNIKGDFSQRAGESSKRFHGFGVWQRDSQHGVDESYLKDVRRQAEDAAEMLAANHKSLETWAAAVAAYNCGPGRVRQALQAGQSVDHFTTGGDYSADVLQRHRALVAAHQPHQPHPAPTLTPAVHTDCTKVPPERFFVPGMRHPCFTVMGQRFLIWLGTDISHDGNGYQPGPVFSTFDAENVRRCQRLMNDAPDGFFGPKQWKRLLTERP